MNNSANITSNSFSLRRMLLLARFTAPSLSRGLLIFGVATLLILLGGALIIELSGAVDAGVALMAMPLSMTIYFSPFLLTHRDFRFTTSQLPLLASEKFLFMFAFVWILAPLAMVIAGLAGTGLINLIFSGATSAGINDFILKQVDHMTQPMEIVSTLSILTIVLFFTIKARRNRVGAGILAFFASMFTLFLLGAICGIVATVMEINNNPAFDVNNTDAFIIQLEVHPLVKAVEYGATILFAALVIFLMVKFYKRLRNSGF